MKPLVTVIGISYNHQAFIAEALDSLAAHEYSPLQIILMDDGSKDQSQQILAEWIKERSGIDFIAHKENRGYTRTFNEGLALAKGDFVIDFALDDVMLPGFIEKSVARLQQLGPEYGVCHSNARFIDMGSTDSQASHTHLEMLKSKGMVKQMPEGDIFEMVLRRYFICTPTMVIRRSVFDRIGGYDPHLAYEDFDFWVRSGRYFKYTYLDEVLMKKRKLASSMSANRLRHWRNEQLESVFKVCEKAFALCKGKKELKALNERLAYEYRQCIRAEHSALALQYLELIRKAGGNSLTTRLAGWLIDMGIDLKRVK